LKLGKECSDGIGDYVPLIGERMFRWNWGLCSFEIGESSDGIGEKCSDEIGERMYR
jgi:hypothetical protein